MTDFRKSVAFTLVQIREIAQMSVILPDLTSKIPFQIGDVRTAIPDLEHPA